MRNGCPPLPLEYIGWIFSFVQTSEPTVKAAGGEDLLKVLYCKIWSPYISLAAQIAHEWNEFIILSLQL